MTPLDFRSEIDAGTTSWTRADPDAALVERHGDTQNYTVTLPDGEVHYAHLSREKGAFTGTCDCKGFEYSDPDQPCAHLCTLRKAEGLEIHEPIRDINGKPITTQSEQADAEADPNPSRPEPQTTIEAPAAGHDGRTFGRPEERL